MITILNNDLKRLVCYKSRIFLPLLMIAGAILAAIFITSKAEVAGHIAVVSKEPIATASTEHLSISWVKEEPPMSDLVSNKYDAYVIKKTDGSLEIHSVKSKEFQDRIMEYLNNTPVANAEDLKPRGVGGNIIGFLTMFLLMEGVVIMYLFSDDKEFKQITRIAVSPVSFIKYLLAHFAFTFGTIFIPTILILYLIKAILGADIGFQPLTYLGLLAVITGLSTAFSMFIHALAKKGDTGNMMGSALVTLTSLLAGSFYSFDKGNKILSDMVQVLPQKQFLSFVNELESGAAWSHMLPKLVYVLGVTVFFFLFAVIKTKREYTSY